MKKLHAQYGELLATARLELFYSGSATLERVREALAAAFATLPRDGIRDIAPVHAPSGSDRGRSGWRRPWT